MRNKRKHIIKLMGQVFLIILMSSCTTTMLNSEGQRVAITSTWDQKKCSFISQLKIPVIMLNVNSSRNELRNEAGKLGGNTIIYYQEAQDFGGPYVAGEVLHCDDSISKYDGETPHQKKINKKKRLPSSFKP